MSKSPTKDPGAGGAGKKDDDGESVEGDPRVSTFQSLAAEGDILAKQGDYRKAIDAYSKALNLRPGDKNGLVARSKCYLQLGDAQAALEDANSALKEDGDFFKGIFQKAEALYATGDFEMALVYYHRGNKLRPELNEFRLGIQKAREAIDNSIGNPRDYKFQPPAGVRAISTAPGGHGGHGGVGSGGMAGQTAGTGAAGGPLRAQGKSAGLAGQGGGGPGGGGGIGGTGRAMTAPGGATGGWPASAKSQKQLLGELYADKEYLETLANDKDFVTNPNDSVVSLVHSALRYLDTRTEFWRQQKPIYARKKEASRLQTKAINARNRQLIVARAREHQEREEQAREREMNPKAGGGWNPKPVSVPEPKSEEKFVARKRVEEKEGEEGKKDGPQTPSEKSAKVVQQAFQTIRNALDKDLHEDALRTAKSLLARLNDLPRLNNRDAVAAELYGSLGSIYFAMGNTKESLQYYRKELTVGKELNLPEAHRRALGNLGRTYVHLHKYKEACNSFQELLQLFPSNAEETVEHVWVLHDLGRCHWKLENYEKAAECGERAVGAADAIKDKRWGLDAR
ncbi:Tetratricopeptide repeat protein 25 [Rhizophlyctis rosea]|nr:Tetratricopeptide repeat protein 25 [Rhizophlyctis rosea]